MASDKRNRTKNFSDLEKKLLIELAKENEVIFSKQKDTKTVTMKEKAWVGITEKYNSQEGITKRDTEGLKVCLVNLQMKAKKEAADQKMELYKTGGGPSALQSLSETSETLVQLMPQVFQSIKVNDDDATDDASKCEIYETSKYILICSDFTCFR
jgi:hypothetical protein